MKNYNFNQMPVFATKDPYGKQIRIKFKTVAKVAGRENVYWSNYAYDTPYRLGEHASLNGEIQLTRAEAISLGNSFSVNCDSDVFIVCFGEGGGIELHCAQLVLDTCDVWWRDSWGSHRPTLCEDGSTSDSQMRWFGNVQDALTFMMETACKATVESSNEWEKWCAKVDRELTEAEKIRGIIKKTKKQKDPRKKFNLLDDWGFDDWARRLDDKQKKDLLALLESDPEMDKTLYYED